MPEENNCIVINFPPGAKGHIASRLIASCDNVIWYNHFKNGNYPWEPYNDIDINFTPFHFTRKFSGAEHAGVCDKTITPVLDIAEKNNISYNKENIDIWKAKLYPTNFVYPLHSELDKSKKFFCPAKHLVIIPKNIDHLVERFMNTTFNYFVSSNDKNKTYKHVYEEKSKQKNISVYNLVKEDLTKIIQNYNTYIDDNDYVLDDVNKMLLEENFQSICNFLDIKFNKHNYQKTKQFILENNIF